MIIKTECPIEFGVKNNLLLLDLHYTASLLKNHSVTRLCGCLTPGDPWGSLTCLFLQ
ncbi:unnamed protein product [Periconia digitata]|uniref:Uncharacterized protein n=1 Tax=Periconia digitata TaxID=1303443 RepID=A0A9W4XV00_9PLEO|nr:unnamed protein product [Periconia digitata]